MIAIFARMSSADRQFVICTAMVTIAIAGLVSRVSMDLGEMRQRKKIIYWLRSKGSHTIASHIENGDHE